MILGFNRYPPLAIEAYIIDNCKFVVETSCPIETIDWDIFDHDLRGRNKPLSSPGSSMPVLVPTPNFFKELNISSFLITDDSLAIPILLE